MFASAARSSPSGSSSLENQASACSKSSALTSSVSAHQQLALVREVEVERGARDPARVAIRSIPRSAKHAPSESSCLGRLEHGGLDRRALGRRRLLAPFRGGHRRQPTSGHAPLTPLSDGLESASARPDFGSAELRLA